ncbi:hypothetical protein ACP70R_019974 [Stipagrostis hirtigluma subsp. patula]
MIRRFVNLVREKHSNGKCSLRRLDVSKHLFYPSTAVAEANSGPGGDKKPWAIESLPELELPAP